jgi:outer membrane protein TolC
LASAVNAAEANQRAALATFAQRMLTALADVEAAFAQQQGERQRLAAAVDAADAAAIASTRATARVTSGLQAEGSALAARLQALAATDERLLAATDASLAAVALWKALGGDLPAPPHEPAPAAIAAQGPTQKAR